MKKHRWSNLLRLQCRDFSTWIIVIVKHLKYYFPETQWLGTMVIPAAECFYGIRKGSHDPLISICSSLRTPAHTAGLKGRRQSRRPPADKSAHRETSSGSAESSSLWYFMQWTRRKEAQKAALKNFCFPPSPHYSVHSSDTAGSWAKMFGVAISYSTGQLESFYVAILIWDRSCVCFSFNI